MEYPNVKSAHVVPRTYLANWASDGKIAAWLMPERTRLADLPIENVGTRHRFYARERPSTGERIDDVEWSLGRGEDAATPLLRTFAERWPLPLDEKIQLRSSSRSRFSVALARRRRTSRRRAIFSPIGLRRATSSRTRISTRFSSATRTGSRGCSRQR
jgi:hypothetical protein